MLEKNVGGGLFPCSRTVILTRGARILFSIGKALNEKLVDQARQRSLITRNRRTRRKDPEKQASRPYLRVEKGGELSFLRGYRWYGIFLGLLKGGNY